MTNPLGPAGFFALEAGECLDRLDALFRAPGGPSSDEFLRTSRALRGSALMANQPPLARAAAGFEALARALRAGERGWDQATREQADQAIEEYRLLIRRVPDWQESDAVRAARLTTLLESLAGRTPRDPEAAGREPGGSSQLQTGVRAFVAREGALIASALDRAARAIRATPDDREPLYMVLRRMQSLQGLAELPELPPLPDILDGIELAVGDLSRLHAPPPGVDEVLAAGARALSRVARDIAETGMPDAEAEEPRSFTALLLEAFAVERDVVPIESLYRPGDAEPVQRPRSVPQFATPTPPGSLELVSLGEHLVQTAGRLTQARSVTELDLRLYRLLGTLRAASAPDGDPVAQAIGALARATRETVASGSARRARDQFVAALQQTGELLRSAPGLERAHLAAEINRAAERLNDLRGPVVAIESLAFESQAALVETHPAPPAAPPSAPAPHTAASPGRLETAFSTYSRLRADSPLAPASIDGLLDRNTEELPSPVPIETLYYSGRSALARAAEIRRDLQERLGRDVAMTELRPLIEELLDLVPLALADSD
jgi:hypothetical protein